MADVKTDPALHFSTITDVLYPERVVSANVFTCWNLDARSREAAVQMVVFGDDFEQGFSFAIVVSTIGW